MFKIEDGSSKNSGNPQRSKCIRFNTLNGYFYAKIARETPKGERAVQLSRQTRSPQEAKTLPRWMRHLQVRRAAHASDNFMERRQGALCAVHSSFVHLAKLDGRLFSNTQGGQWLPLGTVCSIFSIRSRVWLGKFSVRAVCTR